MTSCSVAWIRTWTAYSGLAGRRRSTGSAGGHLFILFKYEMFVNAGLQAVRAAWVNIWGVRHVCGALLLFSVSTYV